MKERIRYAALFAILCIMPLMTACSPQTDTTDPLSNYSVDVNVPFATNSAGYQTAKPDAPAYTISTQQAVKIVGWMNESMDASQQDAYTELSLGSIGTAVKNLQKRLIELGYMSGTASGTFDQATAQAVRLFESAYSQKQTGTASPLMQVYLFSNNAKIYTGTSLNTPTPTPYTGGIVQLERGNTGNQVVRLQNRLIELGYLSGSASGIFDINTENAIKEFEAAYGKQRTGVATAALQTTLYSGGAYRYGQTAPTYTVSTQNTEQTDEFPPLQYGSRGDDVKLLQQRLKELGYLSGKADGIYGNATVKAVKAFEAAYNQKQTGVATSAMQKHLFSNSAKPYSPIVVTPTPVLDMYRTLSNGDYGDEVVALQTRLKQLGYLSGKADGFFGDNTEKAVKAFEARYGRMQTGIATPTMQQYLFADDALKNSSSANTQTEYVALSEGSYGTSVLALQKRLIQLKYLAGEADGLYGQSTINAVKAFEKAHGRAQTGVASVAFQELLYSDEAESNSAYVDASAYTRLKNGDKNDAVAKLQRRLIELGYLTGTVDGYFGDGTEAAVRAFENAYNQPQTGIATPLLQSYLFSENALRNPNGEVAVSYATLNEGDSGEAVKRMQTRLIELGYLSGKADGKFGDATEKAVKKFQKALGLTETGRATSALQKELYSESAPAYQDTSIVTVNRKAKVTAKETYVYSAITAQQPIGVLYKGTEIMVLRTSGEWAEIQNDAGSIAYAKKADFALVVEDEDEGDFAFSGEIQNVNKTAYINRDGVIVYKTPNTSSEMLGKLKTGVAVTWLRTNGDWAEVMNSAGDVGYMNKAYLAVSESVLPGQSEYTPLRNGNTGEKVKEIQRRLKALGYFGGDIGGNYLTKTTAAVKAFQKAIGLEPTGEATVALQEILFSYAAPASGQFDSVETRSYPVLTIGMENEYVGEMQLKLIGLGYLNASDCKYASFDKGTEKALVAFQQAMGFTYADGVASPEIQAFLGSDAANELAN
ncbi:MAG: peptidoglycan-binding protein [Clostridia bacterium]|nr:peptidoglycan-binding protein [Clostridia bacterium]